MSQSGTTNPQPQCHLFRLPAELRSHIYKLTLTSNAPIIDPTIGPLSSRSKHKSIPPLGVDFARSCRRIYNEVDIRPLYTSNEFVFTEPSICSNFLIALSSENRALISSVTLDLRENMNEEAAKRASGPWDRIQDWAHFLACSNSDTRFPSMKQVVGDLYLWTCQNTFHFYAHVPPLRSIVLDICELQRTIEKVLAAYPSLPKPGATVEELVAQRDDVSRQAVLWTWWEMYSFRVPATACGLEVCWLRKLDKNGEIRTVQIPVGVWSQDIEHDCRREKVIKEWWKEEYGIEFGRY